MSDISSQGAGSIEGVTRRVVGDEGSEVDRGTQRRRRLDRRMWVAVPLVVMVIAGVGALTSRSEMLSVVFPDGSSVDLIYPKKAGLEKLEFFPGASIQYLPYGEGRDRPDQASAHPCCSRGLTIKRGAIREVMGERVPAKVYTGARGQDVPFFDSTAIGAGPDNLPELAFQFGSWTVLAFDYPAGDPARGTRMTDEQRAVFASSLDGHENKAGFLVLEPRRPLCLLTVWDGPNGTLGDFSPLSSRGVMFYLQPQWHGRGQTVTGKTTRGYDVVSSSPDSDYVSLRLPDNQFELSLTKDLRRLQNDIEISNLKQETRWRC